MSHYLPAPYEAAPDDDLGAAVGATLTGTLAVLTAWIVGVPAYDHIRSAVELLKLDSNPSEAALRAAGVGAGWAVAVLFLVFGTLGLILRRGRGGLIFGALVSLATTLVADTQFKMLAGDTNPWMYYAGVAVVIAALLPATKRWLKKPPVAAPVVIAAPAQIRIGQNRR